MNNFWQTKINALISFGLIAAVALAVFGAVGSKLIAERDGAIKPSLPGPMMAQAQNANFDCLSYGYANSSGGNCDNSQP